MDKVRVEKGFCCLNVELGPSCQLIAVVSAVFGFVAFLLGCVYGDALTIIGSILTMISAGCLFYSVLYVTIFSLLSPQHLP